MSGTENKPAGKDPALSPDFTPSRPRSKKPKRISPLPIVALAVLSSVFLIALFQAEPDAMSRAYASDEQYMITSSRKAALDMTAGHEAGVIPPAGVGAPAAAATSKQDPTAAAVTQAAAHNQLPPLLVADPSATQAALPDVDAAVPPLPQDGPAGLPQTDDLPLLPPEQSQSSYASNPGAELEAQSAQEQAMTELRQEMFVQALRADLAVSLPRPADSAVSASPLAPKQAKLQQLQAELAHLEASGQRNTATYAQKLAQLQASGLLPSDAASAGKSQGVDAYGRFDGKEDRWALGNELQDPGSPYELRAGSVIPAILNSHINSDLPGPIRATVSIDVRDTATGEHVLIPQGSRLIGAYASGVAFGQDGLLVAWQRIVYPDGKALDIGAMPGADSSGQMGLRDQVDNHYFRIFASALLLSGITAGIATSQDSMAPDDNRVTIGGTMSQSLGNQLGQLSEEVIRRNMAIAPTIEIRAGKLVSVEVQKDLTFGSPYRAFDYTPAITADGQTFR